MREKNTTQELSCWNDNMVLKYHKNGTLFESKNPILRLLEHKRINKMIKVANLKPSDMILDLGCGEGFLLSKLPKTKKVVGLDISRVALKRAKNEILKDKDYIKLFWGNAEKIMFKEKMFDVVFCSEVLEHVPSPKKVINEINRVLKDNGRIIVSVPDETRIQSIMKIIKFFHLNKLLHSARKTEKYEWHLHHSDIKFIKEISIPKFELIKIIRVPRFIGYRFVVLFRKK